jgi:hypothetical protein
MDARVTKAFWHTNTGRLYRVGEWFRGDDVAARQLADRGYLSIPGEVAVVSAHASDATDYATLTVSELRALCDGRGIDVPKRARKADLVAALADDGRG